MKTKKIVFFGLGGAGQRHLRILHSLKKKLNLSFFAFRKIKKVEVIKKNFSLDGRKLCEKYKDLVIVQNEKHVLIKKNVAIISNHTSGHYETALKCAKAGMDIFVEKPFFCSKKNFNFIEKIIKKKKLKFLVGYQRRYSALSNQLLKITKKLDLKKIKKVNIVVNSFVPDWHKYENFRTMYVCKKKLGGGSLLTECHEIDIIIMMFGLPKKVFCKKYYDISYIDVESRHRIIFYYQNFSVYFNINIFSKKIKRTIYLKLNNCNYSIDLNHNKIYMNKKIIYSNNQTLLNNFTRQMKFFFSDKMSVIKNISQSKNNLLLLNACIKSDKNNKLIRINE